MRLNFETIERFYRGRRVLVTGHTGFKGSWLTLWLHELGAEVTGLALPPEADPCLFHVMEVKSLCRHTTGDIHELATLERALDEARPEVVIHLAAQALVRRSYVEPLATVTTNILGTANLLEAVRRAARPCAVVVVTSDKCYENREQQAAYVETDPMGGHDVYSMSKGAAELVVSSYRRSFFPAESVARHGVAIASARAGNVIGGGDFAADRLVPDAIAALAGGRELVIRNPASVRPWQHVLEPLGGYLWLGALLGGALGESMGEYCEAWNFGPTLADSVPVDALTAAIVEAWGAGSWRAQPPVDAPHEAGQLRLAIDKARERLGWSPRWNLREAVSHTVAWYRAHADGADASALASLARAQIAAYRRAEPTP